VQVLIEHLPSSLKVDNVQVLKEHLPSSFKVDNVQVLIEHLPSSLKVDNVQVLIEHLPSSLKVDNVQVLIEHLPSSFEVDNVQVLIEHLPSSLEVDNVQVLIITMKYLAKSSMSVVAFTAVTLICNMTTIRCGGPYDWMKPDKFNQLDGLFHSVNAGNCRSKSKQQLLMRSDVVSQLPVYNHLLSKVWYRNRTSLIHIHNMALNRAMFHSYILQKMNDSESFHKQPDWRYFYFSAASDVNANPNVLNGSAFYFDTDCHYANWLPTLPFNKTIHLFGPRAFRWDDYRDQDNYLREPTRTVVKVTDIGSGNSNYTHPGYKMNTWYTTWLPDTHANEDSLTKFTYYIDIKQSNVTGKFQADQNERFAFFGPSMPGAADTEPKMLPVQFTAPYFDCGGANKWVVSAVSPVVDFMPRYSNFTHLRRQKFVGVVVMDIDLNKIDFNSCGVSPGNPGPSYLSGIDRCKRTTSCKHKAGFGLKRGGYICVCKPGTRWPWWQEPPYQGADIEMATEEEYKAGFLCLKNQHTLVLPVIDRYPGVHFELGDQIVSSGGPPANSQADGQAEKQRSSGDVHGDQHSQSRDPTDRDSIKKIIEDAEMIREFRIRARRDVKSPHANDDNGSTEDDYVIKNMVDVDVERLYQDDVRAHVELRNQLLAGNGMKKNLSSIETTLLESMTKLRDRHAERFKSLPTSGHGRVKRASVFDDQAFDRMMKIMRQKASVTSSSCHKLPNHQLFLPGDVSYGVNAQFESEGRTALRLSHFLSLMLQSAPPGMTEENSRAGPSLHVDHMFGEVLANVMGNFRIVSAGLYFDRDAFIGHDGKTRELFGPWAYKKSGSFYAIDTAGLTSAYVDQDWFVQAKSRFATNVSGVKTFKLRAYLRSDIEGTSTSRHENFPLIYRAATYELGFWTSPHFRCDGKVDQWVMTYVSPFFGVDSMGTKLVFRGVTTVDVPLNLLEINQCPQDFRVANAFKNTARCDYFSTTCSPLEGFPFTRGSYTCKCRLGFEYWHLDGKEWFEGSFLELEYEKKKAGIFSRL
ncbi:unnamed protein product, partial [Lymnaea stagnalis]